MHCARGVSADAAQAQFGFSSSFVLLWEERRLARPREGRHHLAVDTDVEDAFWRCFLSGTSSTPRDDRRRGPLDRLSLSRARFSALREQGLGVRTAAQELRVAQAGAWEAEPRREAVRACGAPRAVLVTRSGLRRAEPGGSRSRHQEAEGDRTDQASTTASCGPIRRSGPRTPLDGQLQAAAARKAPDSAERTEQAPF